MKISITIALAVFSALLAGCISTSSGTQWEYKVAAVPNLPPFPTVKFGPDTNSQDFRKLFQETVQKRQKIKEDFLNDLGKEGWMLVYDTNEGAAMFYFKRPLETDSPQRVEQKRAALSGASGMEVIVSTAEYKPGDRIALHIHHGLEAAYVIQGASVQAPGKDPVVLPTGTSLLHLRDVLHGGFRVVGDTPLKLFTVHIVDKGKPLYDHPQ